MKLSNFCVDIKDERLFKFRLEIPRCGEVFCASLEAEAGECPNRVTLHVLHDETADTEMVGFVMANSRHTDQILPDRLKYLCSVHHPSGDWHFFERH